MLCVVAERRTNAAISGENGWHSRNDTSRASESNYDDIGDVICDTVDAQDSVYDVIDDEADVTAEECHQASSSFYDDLQQSTRDFVSQQQSQVYQRILPDATTSAADSIVIGQDKERVYLQIIGDDYELQAPKDTTQTFDRECRTHATISPNDVARAKTL